MKVLYLIIMAFLHLVTNVGSLGQENSEVRRNLYNTLKLTKQYFGRYPDSLSLQECSNFDTKLAPVFGLPIGMNDDAEIIQNGINIRRGVCTYSYDLNNTVAVPNLFSDVELTTTIHTIIADKSCLTLNKNRGSKVMDIGIINAYRNQTVVSSEKLKKAIIATINMLNGKYGVRKLCVVGDFNDEKFSLPAIYKLSEIKHPEMAHKADNKSGKKFIDKVFSNVENIRISEVFESCENKLQNEQRDIGHKVMCIEFGKVQPEVTRSKFINRIYKEKCSSFKGSSPFDYQDLLDAGPEAIDVASEYLVEIISGFVSESTIKSKSGRRKNNKKALDMIENDESAKSTCPRKAADFYKFVAEFKNGVEKDDPIVPKLTEFHEKLTKKLHDLNVGDPVKIKETVRKIWMDEPKTTISFPTKKLAKKIILSTSNSGARDFLGLSLAQTKTLFRRSKTGFDMYYNICKAISMSGYIPNSWLTDSISFLFKKKGLRSDPGNWRPITIAPSLGKHNEKLIGYQLKKVRDKNDENHAYCELKSCVTAILNVSEHFKKLRIRKEQLKRINKQLVVVFSAEDISSAFESIDHGALDEFCKLVFDEEGSEVKIRLLIKNYLTRTSFVVDRETKEKIQVIKRYDDRTSPQGSILSPAFWRIFDKIFSQIYKDDLDNLVIQNEFLDSFHHVAYSDDHVTIFSFVFPAKNAVL